MEMEMQNDEAITTLNNPDDLGIYSNADANVSKRFLNSNLDDIKKVESEITEIKSQLSLLESRLNSLPPTPFFRPQKYLLEDNISVLKEKLNKLIDELKSLILEKNKYKKVPVLSFKSSVPLENKNINDSITSTKELKSVDAVKELPVENNLMQGKSEAANKIESTVDDKILGLPKVAFWIGLSIVVLGAGFATYKIIKNRNK
jgi:hypothetical protein